MTVPSDREVFLNEVREATPTPSLRLLLMPWSAVSARSSIRYCRNCCRSTETDVIPAQQIGNHPIPAYAVCTYCGYCHGAIEETA